MLQIPVLDSYEWQKSVIDKTSTPPNSPEKGNRYLIDYNPSGSWHNKPKRIAEFDGNNWNFTEPREGMTLLVKSEGVQYQYVNNKWRNQSLLMNRRTIVTLSESYNITLDDAGIFFIVDSFNEIVLLLPSVSIDNLGISYSFARVNPEGSLVIQANDSDHIADSGAGCTIYNRDNSIEYASLTLTLIQPDRWGIVTGNGTWTTTTYSD